MPDLELTRTREDRNLYVLEGVGTLRLEGLFSTRAVAEGRGREWRFGRRGLWGGVQATDATGAVAGTFSARLRGGGTLEWGEREYAMRRASVWRERYALADGDAELALYDARGWGKRPVRVSIADAASLDPGLLLFGAFVARKLANDNSAAAGAGASAAASG